MLALGMLNPLASSALLTGGITSIAAATLLGGFSWLQWLALMAVPYYALILLGSLYLRLMVGEFESAAAQVVPAAKPGPLSSAEQKTLLVLGATSALLWLTDAIPTGCRRRSRRCSPRLSSSAQSIGVLHVEDNSRAKLSWGLILTSAPPCRSRAWMIQTGAAVVAGRRSSGGSPRSRLPVL